MIKVDWATDDEFKGLYAGQRGLIIGRGKNAEYQRDKSLDRFKGIKIGCNSAYKTTGLDALVWMDPHFFETHWQEIVGLNCLKFAVEPLHYDHHGVDIRGIHARQPERCSESFDDGFYPCNLSGYLALNIALIMGLNPIWLYGFNPDTEELKRRSESFELLAKWAWEHERDVYTADKGSEIRELFEYRSLFGQQ